MRCQATADIRTKTVERCSESDSDRRICCVESLKFNIHERDAISYMYIYIIYMYTEYTYKHGTYATLAYADIARKKNR